MAGEGLRVEGLEVEASGRRILHGVSFAAPRGSLVAVLGPNGAGKTTLLKAVSGLLKPSSGRVLLGGVDLYAQPPRMRARLAAYTPPEPGRGLGQLVEEYIAAGLYPRLPPGLGVPGEALGEARRLLALLEAEGLAGRSLSTLSSGEAQRAALLHSIIRRPLLLAVDEPTAHQDPRGWVLVARLLRLHASQGGIVVAATHDTVFAGLYSDFTVALRGGRILFAGPTREVLNRENAERLYRVPFTEAVLPDGRRVPVPEEPRGD